MVCLNLSHDRTFLGRDAGNKPSFIFISYIFPAPWSYLPSHYRSMICRHGIFPISRVSRSGAQWRLQRLSQFLPAQRLQRAAGWTRRNLLGSSTGVAQLGTVHLSSSADAKKRSKKIVFCGVSPKKKIDKRLVCHVVWLCFVLNIWATSTNWQIDLVNLTWNAFHQGCASWSRKHHAALYLGFQVPPGALWRKQLPKRLREKLQSLYPRPEKRNCQVDGFKKRGGTHKSSNLMGFSLINHPFGGTPNSGPPHICHEFEFWMSFHWD